MMQYEFEQLAGYKVDHNVYKNVIEPMYLATEVTKSEFVKMLDKRFFEVREARKPNIKKMRVENEYGYNRTPNHCYWFIEYVDLVGVDIKTGKYVIAPLETSVLEELQSNGMDLCYSSGYDFDYSDCLNKKKPVLKTGIYPRTGIY